jgi:hypothetical protein
MRRLSSALVVLLAFGLLELADAQQVRRVPQSSGGGGGVSKAAANTWTAAQAVALYALTDGATVATNAALANTFSITLGGNRTLANPTNLVGGGTYQWIVKQDGTGSRTLAYGNKFKWPGGATPTLTTAAASVDVISCVYNGTNLLCTSMMDVR